MKRVLALAAAILVLSGCVPHTELDDIAISEIMGIDRDGGGYTLTLQYFNTDASGGVTAVDSSSPNAVTVTGSGSTPEAALEALAFMSGRNVMLGALEVIVLGSDTGVSVTDRLSTAASHYSGNPRCFVAFADGKASDVLNVKFTEGNASVDKLEGMMQNAESLGLNCTMRLYEAMEMLSEPTESLAVPMMKVYQAGSDYTEDGSNITLTGGALCTGDRFVDKLTGKEMSGVQLLNHRNGTCEMVFAVGGKDARVMLYGIRTEVTPRLTDDGSLDLQFAVTADCKFVGTSISDPYKAKERIRELCEREMDERITAALTKALNGYGADIFSLSYKIRSQSPEMWRTIAADYRQFLKDAHISADCTVSIERFGIVHG